MWLIDAYEQWTRGELPQIWRLDMGDKTHSCEHERCEACWDEIDVAEERAEQAERERDEARAEVERLKGVQELLGRRLQASAENVKTFVAEIERLRGALEEIAQDAASTWIADKARAALKKGEPNG